MRTLAVLLSPLLVLTACGERPSDPSAPSLELTNPARRMPSTAINAHAYGSFRVGVGAGGSTIITSGPANFPGHPPAGPGSCVDGRWFNPQGKPTTGSLTKPHPHCIQPAAAIEVVLEPISTCFAGPLIKTATCAKKAVKGYTVAFAWLGESDDGTEDAIVEGWQPSDPANALTPPRTVGSGTITGYAIDAATLGTTNTRVGTLTLNLLDYNSESLNLMDADGTDGCVLDATILAPCLNRVISARYNPLPAPAGIGPTDFAVEGFLWFTPADQPYNYGDVTTP
jgi:hypothetical protein